ncbi:hypothetical protein [Spirosoma pulveris]
MSTPSSSRFHDFGTEEAKQTMKKTESDKIIFPDSLACPSSEIRLVDELTTFDDDKLIQSHYDIPSFF